MKILCFFLLIVLKVFCIGLEKDSYDGIPETSQPNTKRINAHKGNFPISTFPDIKSKTLTNNDLKLPKASQQHLLILGFDQKSADAMEAWVRQLELVSSSIEWYQMAVIGSVPPFVDRFIINGLKSSVTDIVHERFIPYFGDAKILMNAVAGTNELMDPVTPFIIIVDQSKKIQFNMQETVSTENIMIVKKALSDHFEQ